MKYDAWKIKSKYPKNLIRAIIEDRKIKDSQKFLNPNYKDIYPSRKLSNIREASNRIKKAIREKESIGLFCDYDADGVCGGAIIYRTLKHMKADVTEYVPQRKEGYGLNDQAVQFFISKKIKLLITVDCGIKNTEQIKSLSEEGIDSIVIDHHIIDDDLPNAIIIHPELTSDQKNLGLSGGGTAYMLARYLFSENGQEKWLIDLAAISSVADVVSLNHDNRIIVKYGMMVLEKTRNKGLKQLLEVSGILNKTLSVYDLGFGIAPRLNAAGRIAHPKDSFDLLAKDDVDSRMIAEKLNQLNQKRQEMLKASVDEALIKVERGKAGKKNLIILKGDWDEGIVGLIASKVCEKYYRPTIVLSESAKQLKGSARSIEKINITSLISCAEDLLLSFGGHAQAAGLSLSPKNFKKIKKILEKEAEKFKKNLFERELRVDALVNFDQLTIGQAEEIERLSPFGPGNPRPILAIENVQISACELIGKDENHMKAYCNCNNQNHCFLFFNFESRDLKVNTGGLFDIAFSLSINEFRGNKKLDLIVEDVKKSK